MKQLFFLSLSAFLLIGLNGCDKFSLKKKTEDYRVKLQGYYTTRIVETTYSAFPEPPSGVTSDITREVKVEKAAADSTIIVDGMTFKLPADEIYDYSDPFVSDISYNFVHLDFYSENKVNGFDYVKSTGDAALYKTITYKATYNRPLE